MASLRSPKMPVQREFVQPSRRFIVKVFVWERVEKCSDNYHSDGGVVVFAESEQRAREIANTHQGCEIREDEKPTYVRDVLGSELAVFIMPNAGCC